MLLIAFRSFLVPRQAALGTFSRSPRSFGVLTACFQWGWGLGIVGLDADQRRPSDRELRAADDVRHPLRPLDGLPGVPAEPGRARTARGERATARRSPTGSPQRTGDRSGRADHDLRSSAASSSTATRPSSSSASASPSAVAPRRDNVLLSHRLCSCSARRRAGGCRSGWTGSSPISISRERARRPRHRRPRPRRRRLPAPRATGEAVRVTRWENVVISWATRLASPQDPARPGAVARGLRRRNLPGRPPAAYWVTPSATAQARLTDTIALPRRVRPLRRLWSSFQPAAISAVVPSRARASASPSHAAESSRFASSSWT